MSSNRKQGPARRERPAGRPPRPVPEGIRLQKVLAAAGVASRRAAEELIEQGRVTVGGEVVRVQGMRVDPARARIEVDGERVNVDPRHEYLLLNKPAGVVTTARDPQRRRTVLDLVRTKARVYPVGRLDVETQGLVLLTSHGELAHRMTHPRYQVPRMYVVEVRGVPNQAALRRLERGVRLEDGPARAMAVRIRRQSTRRAHIEITMTEGRKHEVRRMMDAIGHPVLNLVRVGFGPLRLGRLRVGESRPLTPAEVGGLLANLGL